MPDLDRFRTAQLREANGYAQAKREISAGKKTGHWIWYILPQLNILGFSPNAQYYGIVNFEEACDYLRDETLFKNYHEMIKLIELQLSKNLRLERLMGFDDVKLISSLTLFRETASFLGSQEENPEYDFNDLKKRCDNIFAMIAKQGYYPCMQTESYLQSQVRPDPKPSVSIQPCVSVRTTPVEPSVVPPKTTLFEPAAVHSKPIPDEPPVVPIKTTRDEPPVSIPMTPVESAKRPEALSPLVSSLEGYINMRGNEWSFHYNFLGIVSLIYLILDTLSGSDHFHEKSRDIKINAATKLKQILEPTAPELNASLTHAERAALKEGRLGELVAEHGSLLEQLIQNAPEKHAREDASYSPLSF